MIFDLIMKLSVCLAVYNEEENMHYAMDGAYEMADEIVIVDGGSTDKTVAIARSYGGKVRIIHTNNPPMFHINKQKAMDAAKGEWILQLDADEQVTKELAEEIKKVISMSDKELEEYEKNIPNKELFLRHQRLIIPKSEILNPKQIINQNEEIRNSQYNAFFIPRLNYFLGKFLKYGGVYPDGVIRLIRRGKARLPCKDVHELMEVEGKTGWLQNPLQHFDSPTFKRYLERNNRYVNLLAQELKDKSEIRNPKSRTNSKAKIQIKKTIIFIEWVLIKPLSWFFMTTFRHKGILDGWQGVVFSFFSALRFPRAYWRFISNRFG